MNRKKSESRWYSVYMVRFNVLIHQTVCPSTQIAIDLKILICLSRGTHEEWWRYGSIKWKREYWGKWMGDYKRIRSQKKYSNGVSLDVKGLEMMLSSSMFLLMVNILIFIKSLVNKQSIKSEELITRPISCTWWKIKR